MSKITGNTGYFKISSNTIKGVKSWSLDRSVGVIDITEMGTGVASRSFISDGLSTGTASVEVIFDNTEANYPDEGDTISFELSNSYHKYSGSAIVSSVSEPVAVGAEVTQTYSLQLSGTITKATV